MNHFTAKDIAKISEAFGLAFHSIENTHKLYYATLFNFFIHNATIPKRGSNSKAFTLVCLVALLRCRRFV